MKGVCFLWLNSDLQTNVVGNDGWWCRGQKNQKKDKYPSIFTEYTKSIEGVRNDDDYYYQLKINENANAIKTNWKVLRKTDLLEFDSYSRATTFPTWVKYYQNNYSTSAIMDLGQNGNQILALAVCHQRPTKNLFFVGENTLIEFYLYQCFVFNTKILLPVWTRTRWQCSSNWAEIQMSPNGKNGWVLHL